MKNTFIIVTLTSLLTACAGLQQQHVQPKESSALKSTVTRKEAPAEANKVANTDISSLEDTLPATDFNKELLFKILSAEIAQQRGQWQAAYISLLALAQQTRDPRLARRALDVALNAKQGGEALSAIRLWRELAPNSEEATQYFLSFIVLSDDLDSARPILAQRLKDARPAVRSLMMLQIQRILVRAKNKPAAFLMLEDVLTPYLSSHEARIALAQAAIANGDKERAIVEARKALTIKPDSELGILTLAQVTTDKNESLQLMASFLSAYPKAKDVRLTYARVLIEQKQYENARREFLVLLDGKPDDLSSTYALGMLSVQTNDFDAAEKYLTSYVMALSKTPDEDRDPTQAFIVLAQIAEERKNIDAAIKWLSQVESGDAYLGAQIKRAQLLAKLGRLVEARALLASLKPEGERDQSKLIIADAQLLRDANHVTDALAVLQTGLRQFPNNTDVLYDYAMVAEKANNIELMESTLRKIIYLAPDNPHAYNALGYSLAERNIRLQEALTLIEKALALAPDDAFIMDSMGWVQFRLGDIKEAEATLRRAYALRPDPEIGIHLGEVLWVKGQKEDAQKLWRDANTKDPQNDTLKSTLARLRISL